MGRTPKAFEWLKAHVDHTGAECLLWPFGRTEKGYGRLSYGDRLHRAHRLMCFMAHGEPPTPAHEASHECQNKACVNPLHLTWKTHRENDADRLLHGTTGKKLTAADVVKIRALECDCTQAQIAAMFGVSGETISSILRGDTWGHIEDGQPL